ncbi:putative glycerophosphodiester phosphodiesterase [Helianthus annuus]|uniref:Glycerophosphodiester phosphodiesterase n=1 Tax=Helianthus annuus TaxID=4232 RepID=A0A9K3DW01_HELAN|nr:putative glycerophosphodiester phosphodiesterase [Helianthus annuus]
MMFLDLLCCVSNESWDYQGCLCWNCTGVDVSNILKGLPKFTVVGHRGHEMNILQSTDNKMKTFKRIQFFRSIKLLIIHLISLNLTFRYLFLDMCCVMKDDTPIIFHDNFIISEENGNVVERPVLFSSFQPDVALLMKKLQHQYPVSI